MIALGDWPVLIIERTYYSGSDSCQSVFFGGVGYPWAIASAAI